MKDKSLDIGLMVIFGVAGFALLAAAWIVPDLQPDRLLATIGGGIGISFAIVRWRRLNHPHREEPDKPAPVRVRADFQR